MANDVMIVQFLHPGGLAGAVFHGLRHHHKTVLDELGIYDAIKYERMGHRMPGIVGVYVTSPT